MFGPFGLPMMAYPEISGNCHSATAADADAAAPTQARPRDGEDVAEERWRSEAAGDAISAAIVSKGQEKCLLFPPFWRRFGGRSGGPQGTGTCKIVVYNYHPHV